MDISTELVSMHVELNNSKVNASDVLKQIKRIIEADEKGLLNDFIDY